MITAGLRVQSSGAGGGRRKNDRGVALIIVLLVTALLIALVFEFAYGTRISLRAAVNFRDNQRAFFLARSGLDIFGKFKDNEQLKDMLPPQGEWSDPVPILSAGDTELRMRWEDESGKINISNLSKPSDGYDRMVILFTDQGINQEILNRISAWMIEEKRNFYLVTELHQFLSDEEFQKVQDKVTVSPVLKINVNTASADVLRSIGMDPGLATMLVERRNREPFNKIDEVTSLLGPQNTRFVSLLDVTSSVFKVDSFASVGGYTKQVEAIIQRTGTAGTAGATYKIVYWRAL